MVRRRLVRKNSARFIVWAGTAALIGAAVPAHAGPATDIDQVRATLDAQKAKLDAQEKLLKAQMRQLDEQKKALSAQQQQIDSLRVQLTKTAPAATSASQAQPLGAKILGTLRGAGTGGEIAQSDQPVGQAPARPERPPEINVLPDRGGVLTPRGTLVYEPTFEFAHSTDSEAIISGFTVLPLLIGTINVTSVNHNTIQFLNTFRLGLTNRAEIEAQIPYVYATQETTTRPVSGTAQETTFNTEGSDLGDIVVGGHYQFNAGEGGWPYLIGNVLFKTRTGTDPFSVPVNSNTSPPLPTRVATGSGFYTVEPSLTAIYPSDPAVFFGSLGYLHTFGRSVNSPLVGGAATVEPGDAIHASFGLGFGINEQSSFSLGYDYESFFKTTINNVAQPGTDIQVGQVLIGYSYKFSDRVSTTLTTSIGVTHDAPNTQVIIRVPIKFQLFGDSKT